LVAGQRHHLDQTVLSLDGWPNTTAPMIRTSNALSPCVFSNEQAEWLFDEVAEGGEHFCAERAINGAVIGGEGDGHDLGGEQPVT
jgi:hypothetical protein